MTERYLKYFTIAHKKAINLGKRYLLLKIYKRLFNVSGRPVISNCGSPAEKVSELLDRHFKSLMQESWSYIKDSNDFLNKMKNLKDIPKDAILITADVVGLHPSIPYEAGLQALKQALDKRENRNIAKNDFIRIVEFVLKKNYFEFNGQVKQQISDTAIGTKFAPAYACIFMNDVESTFLETQSLQPLIWFRYIDNVFFMWTHGEEKLQLFLSDLNNCNPHIKVMYEFHKEHISFLDLKVNFCDGKLKTDLHVKPSDRHQYLHYTSAHPNHTKRSIVYSQELRFSKICSYKNNFEKHLEEMKSWFGIRGYPDNLVKSEMSKECFSKKTGR